MPRRLSGAPPEKVGRGERVQPPVARWGLFFLTKHKIMLIPIDGFDGALIDPSDGALLLTAAARPNSRCPEVPSGAQNIIDLVVLWRQSIEHGSIGGTLHPLLNRDLIPNDATIQFHFLPSRYYSHWTILVPHPIEDRVLDNPRMVDLLHWLEEHDKNSIIPAPKQETIGKPGHIYLLEAENGLYKIGRTTQAVEDRKRQLERDYPLKIRLVHSFEVDDCLVIERQLLDRFAHKQKQGEWFALDDKDVSKIISLSTNKGVARFG